jgi:hypothetical protein
VRSNKGSGLKFKAMLNFELKKVHFTGRIKLMLPLWRNQMRKKGKIRTCYICRDKGHLSSTCSIGNSSNPIIINDVYSLCKDKVGNVFAKFVGTQSDVKKRTIWVAKPIMTNFLGPNLVGYQQEKT